MYQNQLPPLHDRRLQGVGQRRIRRQFSFDERDNTVTGHIVACFLALRLEVDLQRWLDERQMEVSWPDLMRDLVELWAVEVTLDGERNRLRADLTGYAYRAFAAAGVRPPATVTAPEPAPPTAPEPPEVDRP